MRTVHRRSPGGNKMPRRFLRLFLAVFLPLLIISGDAHAQIPTAQIPPGTGRPGVIQYAEAGEISISVNVWGDVRVPGRYIIPRGTDLIELLTIAGGPGIGTQDARLHRTVFVRVSRDTAQGRSVVFEATVADLAAEGETYPGLQEGDIVAVETHTRERLGWRDAANLVGTAATLFLLVERLIAVSR